MRIEGEQGSSELQRLLSARWNKLAGEESPVMICCGSFELGTSPDGRMRVIPNVGATARSGLRPIRARKDKFYSIAARACKVWARHLHPRSIIQFALNPLRINRGKDPSLYAIWALAMWTCTCVFISNASPMSFSCAVRILGMGVIVINSYFFKLRFGGI